MSVAAPRPPAPVVAGLSCPSCGGALRVELGLRVAVCPYCHKHLRAVGEVGVRRLAVQPEVSAQQARQTARAWLRRGWSKDPKLRTEAEIGEAFLCFLPFFRIQADVVGYALGKERRTRRVGKRTQVYYVDVERRVERAFERTVPGVNVGEWGVERIDLEGDTLVPFDEERLARQGMVFPPTTSELEAMTSAVTDFEQIADPSSGLHQVSFKFLEPLRRRLTVVFYPLWVVRYRFRARSYQVLVDAENGALAYGKAPGNDFFRAAMLVAAQAAAGFVGTTGARLAMAADDDGFGLLLLSGGLALAILWAGWRKFRYGGVVIEGSGAPRAFGADGLRSALGALGSRSLPDALARLQAAGKKRP